MTSTLNKVVIFSAGAAIGSFLTWRFLNARHERIMEEELERIKDEIISELYNNGEEFEEEDDEIEEYEDILADSDYFVYPEPYVISSEEVGDCDYEVVCLTAYADDILVDEYDDQILDISATVGDDFRSHFEPDAGDLIFIRNDRLKIDYEVVFDTGAYSESNVEEDE